MAVDQQPVAIAAEAEKHSAADTDADTGTDNDTVGRDDSD